MLDNKGSTVRDCAHIDFEGIIFMTLTLYSSISVPNTPAISSNPMCTNCASVTSKLQKQQHKIVSHTVEPPIFREKWLVE